MWWGVLAILIIAVLLYISVEKETFEEFIPILFFILLGFIAGVAEKVIAFWLIIGLLAYVMFLRDKFSK